MMYVAIADPFARGREVLNPFIVARSVLRRWPADERHPSTRGSGVLGRAPPVPMHLTMSVQDLALVRGIADTRATLKRWSARPGPVIGE
jgi:hypothetical protein